MEKIIKTFCFRAECERDVQELRKKLGDRILRIGMVIESVLPDVEVKIDTVLSIEDVKTVMNRIRDGHVMFETIALKEEYTGYRWFDH